MKKLILIIALLASGGLLQSEPAIAATVARQEISVAEPTLMIRHGGLEISCPPDGKAYTFQIYSITGQLIKKIQLSEANSFVELQKGCYIVKCEAWVKKAVIC